MATVKVCWSGGKDSTASTFLHLEQGDEVTTVTYIPMFTKDIPLIRKPHFEYIMKTSDHFTKLGARCLIVSGMTYWDYVTHVTTRGKYKGLIFGFPCIITGLCGFKRDSKVKTVNNVDVGYFDYEDIGIAYDEIHRQNQLTELKRSILYEKKLTENDAKSIVTERWHLSPIYETTSRDGCVLCPHAKAIERELWFEDYPEAKEKLIELQNIVKTHRPDRPPLRGHKYFIE